ncbi:MAG: hypothetical protein JXR77_18030 [Lentisphaeria bacterium]|nr:hypothetical protein [Lentisphaeria bacterium]
MHAIRAAAFLRDCVVCRVSVALWLCATVFRCHASLVTFTGNVVADFGVPGAVVYSDPGGGGDVGIPPQAPQGTVSGWDIADVRFAYDQAADTLFIGINTPGIFGDADGDGFPGGTSTWLQSLGGLDRADLGGTEVVALQMDINEDGLLDVVVGVPPGNDIGAFGIFFHTGSGVPAFMFGEAVPGPLPAATCFASPEATAPDLEFSITGFLAIPYVGNPDTDPRGFGFRLYAGSGDDQGIGDDGVPGTGGLVHVTVPEPVGGMWILAAGLMGLSRRRRRCGGERSIR